MLPLLIAAVAAAGAELGTPDPSVCNNPSSREAILERGTSVLLQARGSEIPGAAQAKARAKTASDRLMKRMHEILAAANWSSEQKGDFVLRVLINPQVHALDQEFIADILKMRQVAPQLQAADAVARCDAMVRSLSLLDRLNTIDERKFAAMSHIVDQEAAKLGINLG